MRTTFPEATESVSPPGLQRLFRLGAWCFIVVGATHLLVMAVTVLGPPEPAAQRALDAMAGVPTTLPGVRTDMAQLFYGFSVAMALLAFPAPPIVAATAALAAYGWALAITRRGRARSASAQLEGRST
jgi:hypothetical protein